MPRQSSTGRVAQLDSLRGIAAATVVWHHWRMMYQTTEPRWYVVPFVAGHEAVILFFILSGYVLSLPVWTKRQPGYPEYLVRRVCRIYLPYLAAAVLAGVGCYFFLGSRLPLTPWFYETWQTPFSLRMIAGQVLMDPKPVLNTAFWSLRYEMQMSIIFPFVCLLMVWMGRFWGLLLIPVVRVAAYLFIHSRFGQSDLALTVYYAMFFVAGAALSREQDALKRLAAHAKRRTLWLVLALSLFAYFYAGPVVGTERTADIFTMVGVCCIIILIQDPRLHLGLKSPVAEYFGRISYSSYLIHGTVLFALFDLMYGKTSLLTLAICYGVCSLIVAHIFCVFVEEPSHRVGRRIAKLMSGKRLGDE